MDTPNPFTGIFSPQPWERRDRTQVTIPIAVGAQAPLPSTLGDSPGVSTALSTPSANAQRVGSRKRRQPCGEKLSWLQLEQWDQDKTYKEDPPECIRYHLGLNITLNRKSVLKDTKTNLPVAPAPYWRAYLRPELEQVVQQLWGPNTFAKATETCVAVSVARTRNPLTKRFPGLDIAWTEIEDQLIEWGDCFQEGKQLRVDLTLRYEDKDVRPVKASSKNKRRGGGQSATQPMLRALNGQLEAEQESTGQPSAWRDVYKLMRCPGPPCPLGPHCWIYPKGNKHYKLSTLILTEMIKYVEGGNSLRAHEEVPEHIREMIYAEHRHKLDRKRKASTPLPIGMTPVTIHNHYPERMEMQASSSAMSSDLVSSTAMPRLSIPGPRDVSVRRYVLWHQTQLEDERPKAEFQKMGQEILDRCYDLETIYVEKDLEFLKQKVERGIIVRFIRDIPIWAELQSQDERQHST